MGYTQRLRWFAKQVTWETLTLLTYCEMFAGAQAWSAGMRMYGYEGRSYDEKYSNEQNFLTPEGFMIAFCTVMNMHVGSVLLIACPCHSWIWLSRFTCGRHLDVLGDVTQAMIRAQNALVSRTVYLIILCIKRGVDWIVEQPISSILFRHPRWCYLMRRFGHMIYQITLDMGSWTLDCVKPTVLYGTAPYLKDLARKMTTTEKYVVKNNDEKLTTSTSYVKDGKKRVDGGKDLKVTEHSPMGFGCAHARLYHETRHAVTVNPQRGHDLTTDVDSDSEIGEDCETCFDDFRFGPQHFDFPRPCSRRSG